MYFSNLIENIKRDNDKNNLFKNIINPFSGYLLSQHFIGYEVLKMKSMLPSNINNLFINRNYNIINDYDVIYLECILFDLFIDEMLPNINKKIILITGLCNFPQIFKSSKTDNLLNHQNILLWISQNPIYINHPRYVPFPYGIAHYNLEKYAKHLLLSVDKTKHITFLPINNGTNKCRKKLPDLPVMDTCEYYENVSASEFVISPIGDRDDCYRHYECIGLGSIPISNVGETYKALFQDNMYYCDIDRILEIMDSGIIDVSYSIPNRDFICFDYHRDIVMKRIEEAKQNDINANGNVNLGRNDFGFSFYGRSTGRGGNFSLKFH